MTMYKSGQALIFNVGSRWEDSMMPGVSIGRPAAGAPALATFKTNTQVYGFAVGEVAYLSFQFPHSCKQGASVVIKPHVHWAPLGVTVNNERCRWQIEYTHAAINSTFGAEGTDDVERSFTDDKNLTHFMDVFDDITITMGLSHMMIMKLSRIAVSGGDEMSVEAGLLGFDFHLEYDTVGSAQAASK